MGKYDKFEQAICDACDELRSALCEEIEEIMLAWAKKKSNQGKTLNYVSGMGMVSMYVDGIYDEVNPRCIMTRMADLYQKYDFAVIPDGHVWIAGGETKLSGSIG